MSREIKFRAWLPEEQLMCEVDGFDFPNKECTVWHNVFCQTQALMEDIELMQYTGLKDKNGVEVYEGDIVNCSSGCPHEIVFKLEHGGNMIGGMPTFYLSGLNEGYQWMGVEEVIGNIYDNPELLK